MWRWLMLFIPALACSAAGDDPMEALAQAGKTVRDNSSRARNYTCVQTIERSYYSVRASKPVRSCDDLLAQRGPRGFSVVPRVKDRLRLDVRKGPDAEMYSWVGADRFDDRELRQIVQYGASSSGAFSSLLTSLFQGNRAEFQFVGSETTADGRKLFEYSYRVPKERSGYRINAPGFSGNVPYEGSVFLDAGTSELKRLTTRVSELPRETRACEITATQKYEGVRVGDSEFLLPKEVRQRFIELNGIATENVVTFSNCREYRPETVKFGNQAIPGSAEAGKPAARALSLPAGLPVVIELTSRIDSDTAAAGDPFTGRLAKPLTDKSKRVLVPQGAEVEGRLQRVAFETLQDEVEFALKVESVRIEGVAVPFDIAGTSSAPRWVDALLTTGGGPVSRETPENRLNSLCFLEKRTVLKPGFRTEWVTAGPETEKPSKSGR